MLILFSLTFVITQSQEDSTFTEKEGTSINKLIGLCVTRTKPVCLECENSNLFSHRMFRCENGCVWDYSFDNSGIIIKEVSPHGHLTYLNVMKGFKPFKSILDFRWNDDGWARAPEKWCERYPKEIAVWQKAPIDKLIGFCATRIKTSSGGYSFVRRGILVKEVSPDGNVTY